MSNSTPAVIPKKDERKGKPSASYTPMYIACPGSYQLQKQVPPEERPSSEDADRGTRIHDARATGDVSGLDHSEADMVELMAAAEEGIFHQWCDEYGITDAEVFQEKRLWLRNGNMDLFSAKVDFFAISQKTKMALVLDRKSGRKGVTPPVRNWQLKSAVVVLAANYGIVGARVGIVQPFVKTQPLADYSPTDIYGVNGAWTELRMLLERIEDPKAPRLTGTQCLHCAAKHICPEAQAVAPAMTALTGLKWAALTPERKFELWRACKVAEPIIKAILANVKADMARFPGAIPGLVKGDDFSVREITDAVGVYHILAEQFPGLKQEELNKKFNEFCDVGVGAIQTWRREVVGGTATEAEEWFNRVMVGKFKNVHRKGLVRES